MSDAFVNSILGMIAGLIVGAVFLWLVMLPALNYRHIGFWWIAFIREEPPKGYIYMGPLATPLWRRKHG